MQDKTGERAFEILYVTAPEVRKHDLKRGDFVRILSNNADSYLLEKYLLRMVALLA